ncbi:MAG: ATP phosphoribosyltransferase regulatory subunit [Stappia sp.]|uniref:ATP phosphoribosyltransferase regulatory subunit n=1 Tax=Stappia sp. TaxID=1870903 RepID=UPI000C3C712F|nr:ATP phosphoribosyltransferase regulatory subunit [Stappia sp.]MAA97865.1 ATP phosphoribosyltransferase regulatory subunit [Stappia sp.]MBM19721.1 ATP phosphoribosyltransferase regulatory subunit [Stappia sp.]
MSLLSETHAGLASLLETAGFPRVEPAILQPASLFLDLIGEDIRGRMFLTAGPDGEEMCLRPDYTIPVCRAHLDGEDARTPARYSYVGKVFRQRSQGAPEFLQAGVECFGRDDLEAADAEILALGLDSVRHLGVDDADVRIGDEGLFRAVLEALCPPAAWSRRLGELFGETDRLEAALAVMGASEETGSALPATPTLARVLEGLDPAAAKGAVAELLGLTGLRPVGGRSAADIAERLLEQASLSAQDPATVRAAELLSRYLKISGTPRAALAEIEAFAAAQGLDLGTAPARFAARLEALEARGIAADGMSFSASFGRRLDYYTGFVFEIHSSSRPHAGHIVGGGRYDRLLSLLGASEPIPATGFSIWLDRI